ncbi:unnamed protein product [Scytosiphon promiscuus]
MMSSMVRPREAGGDQGAKNDAGNTILIDWLYKFDWR